MAAKFQLHNLHQAGHSEPEPTSTPWKMDGKWSGNSFLLGPSSITNHGGPFLVNLMAHLVYSLSHCELVTKLIFPFKTIFCNLIAFPTTKTTKHSIFPACTLALNFFKSPSFNPIHRRLSNNTKNAPRFPYIFSLDSNDSVKKLFNIQ